MLRVPETQAKDIVLGQKTAVDTRNGIIEAETTAATVASFCVNCRVFMVVLFQWLCCYRLLDFAGRREPLSLL